MTAATLAGVRVLIVEDDYYLASDAQTVLIAAGATVFGPCGDEESGLDLVGALEIDCAILDVNLGTGPSFRLARALRDKGVPFLFVTGYDREALSKEFDGIGRLQKPYLEHDLLDAVVRLVRAT